MTLPLLRNHRITRLNIRRSSLLDCFVPTVGVVLILYMSTSTNAQSVPPSSKVSKTSTKVKISPIQRLKQRSPIHRWKELSSGWLKKKPVTDKTAVPAANPATELSTSAKTESFADQTNAESELKFLPPVRKLPDAEKKAAAQTPPFAPKPVAVPKRVNGGKPTVDENPAIANPATVPNKSLNVPSPPATRQQPLSTKSEPLVTEPSSAKNRLSIKALSDELPKSTPTPIKFAQAGQPAKSTDSNEPIRDPRQLKKLTSILPYFDYEPSDSKVPCLNICPQAEGVPCKSAEGDVVECPEEVVLGGGPYEGRSYADILFQWKASDLYHNPLYFEDLGLERYGHTHGDLVQPFVSAGRFSVQLAGLPYQMTIDPICKKMYALGYYRPGECAPKKYYQVPWNLEAAIREAAIVTGLFLVVP